MTDRLHFLLPNPPRPLFEDYCAYLWPELAKREGHVKKLPSNPPPNQHTPRPSEKYNRARKMLYQGKGVKDIARHVGLSANRVSAIARQINVKAPDHTPKLDHDEVFRLRKAGMTLRAIAEVMECSKGSISYVLRQD